MAELTVLTGLQASGKSTFYRRHLARTHVLVSKDLWPRARRREARQLRLVAEALAAGRDVAVDNTNPSRAERAGLLRVAREHHARTVAVRLESDPEACRRRNAARCGRERVPDVGFHATLGRLEPPTHEEGFDQVLLARFDGRGGFLVSELPPDGGPPRPVPAPGGPGPTPAAQPVRRSTRSEPVTHTSENSPDPNARR